MPSQRKAGAVLAYVSLVTNAAVAFVYVPLLLAHLTTQEYGVYELIGSVIAYLSVMDLGLSTTLARFYVNIEVSGNKKAVQNLLAMAAVVYLAVTLLAVGAAAALDRLLVPVLGSSFTPGELALAHRMMRLVMLNCLAVLPGNWFLAVITANERFVFARSVALVKYVLQLAGAYAVLAIGAGAVGVLAVQVGLNAAVVAAYALYAKRVLPVRPRLHAWDWRLAADLFVFSFFILLNMVFDQVFWKTGQVVLGAVCGSAAVAVYGVACKLITAGYMQVSTGITSVFLPKVTAMAATSGDMGGINELFCRIGRLQAILVWGVLGGFFALGGQFIELWAGADFAQAYAATLVLMLGLSVALIQNLGLTVLQAKNRMGFRAAVYTALAVLDVLISIPVARVWGVVGCAVVAAALLLVGTGPVMNAFYRKKIGLDVAAFWRQVLPLALPVALTTALACIALHALPAPPVSWAHLLVEALAFVALYLAALWLLGFNAYEKGLVAALPKKLLGKGGR